MDRTQDGRPIKILTVIDEYTRFCLALVVARSTKSDDVLHSSSNMFLLYWVPDNIRSDNGPEFTAKAVRLWLERVEVKTAFIEPGSPWENCYNESFNGKLRDELLNGEIFYTIKEAQFSSKLGEKSKMWSGHTAALAIAYLHQRLFDLLVSNHFGLNRF